MTNRYASVNRCIHSTAVQSLCEQNFNDPIVLHYLYPNTGTTGLVLPHVVVFSNCKSAGCLGSPGRLLQADGARQTGSDWLQNMATHIRLHHPTGDSLLVCQVSSGCGAAHVGQYLGPRLNGNVAAITANLLLGL